MDEIAEHYIEGSPQIAQTAVNPDEVTDSQGEQIEGSKTEDSTIKEGTVTYDIRFYAVVPRTAETIKLILNVFGFVQIRRSIVKIRLQDMRSRKKM